MKQVNIAPLGPESIQEAVRVLRQGGLVVGPSRSNYNVICDPLQEAAIDRVFRVKNRTKFGPLTVAVPSLVNLHELVCLPEGIETTQLSQLWPCELTMIFTRKYPFPDNLTCGASTVGITCQGESALQQLLEQFGRPLAVTSANLSGQGEDELVQFDKAVRDLGDKVDFIIKGEDRTKLLPEKQISIEGNTIVDLSFDPPYLVRRGLVELERIQHIFPNLVDDSERYRARLSARLGQK